MNVKPWLNFSIWSCTIASFQMKPRNQTNVFSVKLWENVSLSGGPWDVPTFPRTLWSNHGADYPVSEVHVDEHRPSSQTYGRPKPHPLPMNRLGMAFPLSWYEKCVGSQAVISLLHQKTQSHTHIFALQNMHIEMAHLNRCVQSITVLLYCLSNPHVASL